MKYFPPTLLISLLSVAFPGISRASGPILDARFALHARPYDLKAALCPGEEASIDPNSEGRPCIQYTVTAETGSPYSVYLVVGQGAAPGIAGVSCGVDYNRDPNQGLANALITWTSCADGSFPSDGGFGPWPEPRGGIRVTWNACQTESFPGWGIHAVVGAFYTYAYSEDVLTITPDSTRTSGPEMIVLDCDDFETDLLESLAECYHAALGGRVHFGGSGGSGFVPCGADVFNCPDPVAAASWGRLKSMYVSGSPTAAP